ncbi:MAG: hypothetical protein GF364_19365 [Candidatus Lokiarchaeota archaeon]|nr:hypothetical protein [Candidatus Lokiarchaeota archaeon]
MKTVYKMILIGLMVIGAGIFGYIAGLDILFHGKPTIDGKIKGFEWRDADHKIGFWLNLNNSIDTSTGTNNIDCYNYLYVGEDKNNYYIGVDLCGDRTNNIEGEWIGLYLANNLPSYTNEFALYAMQNYGFENIEFNVSNGQPVSENIDDSFSIFDSSYEVPIIDNADDIEISLGNSEGEINYMWDFEGQRLVLNSEQVNPAGGYPEAEYAVMDFSVNITDKMPDGFESLCASYLNRIDINFQIGCDLEVTTFESQDDDFAEKMQVALMIHDGMHFDISDLEYASADKRAWAWNSASTVSRDETIVFGDYNDTTGMLYFSLLCQNALNSTDDTSFEIFIERMSLDIYFNNIMLNNYWDTSVSSSNYEISYTFDKSPNCEIAHRMFEYRVSKSEFPSNTNKLFVFLAGYGTAAVEGSDFWTFPIDGLSTYNTFPENTENFLELPMGKNVLD